jgi:hypothetical protein
MGNVFILERRIRKGVSFRVFLNHEIVTQEVKINVER